MKSIKPYTILAFLAIYCFVNITPVAGFSNHYLGGEPVHEDITREGLSFLKTNVLETVVAGNIFVDAAYALSSDYHFDGCSFSTTIENINRLYGLTIRDLDPTYQLLPVRGIDRFGQLLHPIQDFYSHSNWVELGKVNLSDDLLDNGLDLWTTYQAYQIIKNDTIIVEGEDIPDAYTVERPFQSGIYPAKAVVVVTRKSDGTTLHGLISGTFGSDDCPDSVSMEHGDLNKDKPGLPGRDATHLRARSLAVAQTQHEWCRLVNLVRKDYGQTGVDVLFDQWVADKNRAVEVCGGAPVDLALTVSASPTSVTVGSSLHYTITVTNNGPSAATNVSLVNTLPSDVALSSVNTNQGSCSTTGTPVKITCAIGTLAASVATNRAIITITLTPTTVGTINNVANVLSSETDTEKINNSVATLTLVKAIDSPQLVAPSGPIAWVKPAYVWNAVSSATSYRLQVTGPAGVAIDQSGLQAASVCPSSTCAVTPTIALSNGSYSWSVQASNATSNGVWSPAMAFVVNASSGSIELPGQATLDFPLGDIGVTTPPYIWKMVSNATSYRLQVKGSTGNIIIDEQDLQASKLCPGSICSFTPSVALSGGNYTWSVQASNASGSGAWSTVAAFSLKPLANNGKPGPATLSSPSVTTPFTEPSYVWWRVSNATSYNFRVEKQDGTTVIGTTSLSDSEKCLSSICAYKPSTTLSNPGSYNWSIEACNNIGCGEKRSLSFAVAKASGGFGINPSQLDFGAVAAYTAVENYFEITVGDSSPNLYISSVDIPRPFYLSRPDVDLPIAISPKYPKTERLHIGFLPTDERFYSAEITFKYRQCSQPCPLLEKKVAVTGIGYTPKYDLSITRSGTGSGTITSLPAGITCGSTCLGRFPDRSRVTLLAMPDSGSSFTSWEGACTGTEECSIWMNTKKFVTARFDRLPTISFDTANGQGLPPVDVPLYSREQDWVFGGTAADPKGQLDRIEVEQCIGQGCNSISNASLTGNSWEYAQNGLSGRNEFFFVVYDKAGLSATSRHLDLRIDLASPTTTLSLNGEANPIHWPDWFTGTVAVQLNAADGATENARSEVREIRYRLDSNPWRISSGSDVTFMASSDGRHTIEYYAIDNVGNEEAVRSAAFQIDQTPPDSPSNVIETHAVTGDKWQSVYSSPIFTWDESTDTSSGIWGYQFCFAPDPACVGYQSFFATDTRQWIPQPNGVRTGTYYLRGRTRDNAGNWSAWSTLFIFRYDGTPPANPLDAVHADGIPSTDWQSRTSVAHFTWRLPEDEGAGIKGYYIYWGTEPDGTSSIFSSTNDFQSTTPLCGLDDTCTGYFRLRSVDNAENPAEKWTTAFVLRYDNTAPTVDFTFNNGITETSQTEIPLYIAATDAGSGVKAMRLSSDGQIWTNWEAPITKRLWTIPAISRQSWPVYLQVRDGIGLISPIVSHTIYLDVNPRQPRSANFRLFNNIISAGSNEQVSLSYRGHSTVGQMADSVRSSSTNYVIIGGYESNSRAIPIIEPEYKKYSHKSGVFTSGSGSVTLLSANFRMVGVVGEVGLPNNEVTLSSQTFQHQAGFLATYRTSAPMSPPASGPPPQAEPDTICDVPRISINYGMSFTTDSVVTLSICAPNAVEMLISNNSDFAGATWEPYNYSKTWKLITDSQDVLPRFVYAAFKDNSGTIYTTYFDNTIHDPKPPSGTVLVGDSIPSGSSVDVVDAYSTSRYFQNSDGTPLAQPLAFVSLPTTGTVNLYLNAHDDNSGVAEMQVSASATFSDTTWEPYSALKSWTPAGADGIQAVYVRFRDQAGNISVPIDAHFILDTSPPMGSITVNPHVISPNAVAVDLKLHAQDDLSEVTDMRIASDPKFSDAVWLPYTASATWPVNSIEEQEGVVYVQYRDRSGNVSEVYGDAYIVDNRAPELHARVQAGLSLARVVELNVYDQLANVTFMHLSNDPQMVDGVLTLPYSHTVTWTFDHRRVLWVQIEDSLGNISRPYPVVAERRLINTFLPMIGR